MVASLEGAAPQGGGKSKNLHFFSFIYRKEEKVKENPQAEGATQQKKASCAVSLMTDMAQSFSRWNGAPHTSRRHQRQQGSAGALSLTWASLERREYGYGDG